MSTGLSALRILIVDDNAQMRTIVGTVLGAAGVRHLRYAPEGRAGLAAITEFKPDVCYVDYEMPVMNGLEFISQVRARPGPDRFLPIIMLTGHSDAPRLHAARDRGVTEFLGKPVTATAILRRLQAVIYHPRDFVTCSTYFGPDRRRRAVASYTGPMRREADAMDVLEI